MLHFFFLLTLLINIILWVSHNLLFTLIFFMFIFIMLLFFTYFIYFFLFIDLPYCKSLQESQITDALNLSYSSMDSSVTDSPGHSNNCYAQKKLQTNPKIGTNEKRDDGNSRPTIQQIQCMVFCSYSFLHNYILFLKNYLQKINIIRLIVTIKKNFFFHIYTDISKPHVIYKKSPIKENSKLHKFNRKL